MNSAMLFTLALTIIAALALVSGRVRPDLLALVVLALLVLGGVVSPGEAFSGFSQSSVVTILAISIISEGLRQTGFGRRIGQGLGRLGRQQEWRLVLAIMAYSAFLSLFMNNIAVVAVMLPAVTTLSRRSGLVPSRLLMPLSFGAILGGMATLLTTSNIIVSEFLRDAGYRAFNLLDFMPIGLPAALAGIVFMILVGRRFLPSRYPAGEAARVHRLQAELASLYGLDRNLLHLKVKKGSQVAGQRLREAFWVQQLGLWVAGIRRGPQLIYAPTPEETIQAGDTLLVQGKPAEASLAGAGLEALHDDALVTFSEDERTILAEVVLAPHSALAGKSLREIHFREKYGFSVLSIWRQGKPALESVSSVPLEIGDALLIQGPAIRLDLFYGDRNFIVLGEEPEPVKRPEKFWLAAAITFLTLGMAAIGVLPVAVVSLTGAALMLLAGCLSMDDAYRAVEWRLIFLVAGMWPLSLAVRSTGLADELVHLLDQAASPVAPTMLALVLLAGAMFLAQLMGGQVASLAIAPFGLAAARIFGLDVRSLGMAIALGCSLAFITPYSHMANVMVMSPGGYTWKDYIKVGVPLTALVMAIILLGLHLFWGL